MVDGIGATPEPEAGQHVLDQLSLVNANLEIPVNPDVAANVLSDGSIAPPGTE